MPDSENSPLILRQYPLGQVPQQMPIDGMDVPIPPVRGAPLPPKKPRLKLEVPHTLTLEEYERDWKPKGWHLLPIGPTSTWRPDWGEWESIRDLVQNALDEAEAYQWGYDREGFWIADSGRGVAVADFLLGPSKLKPEWARGRFGEGMKLAALAFLRGGYAVRAVTVGRELWLIFLRVKTGTGEYAESLHALWRPDGKTAGTKFHIIGYTGPAYEDRFAVNLPRSSIVWEAPSIITQPKQRFNQLIQHPFPEGSRIFARDIYLRDIDSDYSYNLWGFTMAPDRHAPASESQVWADIGRLWCTVNKIDLLESFLKMVKDPPIVDSVESRNVNMHSFDVGMEPTSNRNYSKIVFYNGEAWRKAWTKVMGANAVIRTDDRYDNVMKHLGYQSVSLIWGVKDTLRGAITDDVAIKNLSQERLRETETIPDARLDKQALAHLKLARAIVREVMPFKPVSGVYAAIIPPASDRVRTAGLYGTTTEAVYLALDILYRGRSTIDTLIHELGHHRQFQRSGEAEDLTPTHSEAMTEVAAEVVRAVASRRLDELLKEVLW